MSRHLQYLEWLRFDTKLQVWEQKDQGHGAFCLIPSWAPISMQMARLYLRLYREELKTAKTRKIK